MWQIAGGVIVAFFAIWFLVEDLPSYFRKSVRRKKFRSNLTGQ